MTGYSADLRRQVAAAQVAAGAEVVAGAAHAVTDSRSYAGRGADA